MARYSESGLELDLPDGQHFRFADLPSYQRLSGQHLKEMDFGWIHNGRLILLEVRSYADLADELSAEHFVPVTGQVPPLRFQTLMDKVCDSVLMLLASWAGTQQGLQLQAELPAAVSRPVRVTFAIALDLPAALAQHLQSIRDSLNARLKGRLALIDTASIAILDYRKLTQHPLFAPYIQLAH